jgi:hypothetical protein
VYVPWAGVAASAREGGMRIEELRLRTEFKMSVVQSVLSLSIILFYFVCQGPKTVGVNKWGFNQLYVPGGLSQCLEMPRGSVPAEQRGESPRAVSTTKAWSPKTVGELVNAVCRLLPVSPVSIHLHAGAQPRNAAVQARGSRVQLVPRDSARRAARHCHRPGRQRGSVGARCADHFTLHQGIPTSTAAAHSVVSDWSTVL